MTTSEFPPFFHPSSSISAKNSGCFSGVFRHCGPVVTGDAHTRWWPSGQTQLQTVVLFIPGNPGLIDFYTDFLSTLHNALRDSGLAILAHAHLGHTPHLKVDNSMQRLWHQVEAAIEFFDTIKNHWPSVDIIITGHSVGCWIATQVLKARPDVGALFFLFPTISHLLKTPNGRRLSWAFRSPIPRLASLLSVFFRPLSYFLFPNWPKHQRSVLHSLLSSPRSIFACLTMAHEEMFMITELDTWLLKQHASKIWWCYAEKDNWVGEEQAKIVQSLGSSMHVVHCKREVTHAFCIFHSDIVAAHCVEWFRARNSLT